jgi:hypothetical protein
MACVGVGVGRHADGGGLYLVVDRRADSTPAIPTFNRSWLFLYRSGGRRREMGLGPAQGKPKDGDVDWFTLATAREKARDLRATVRAGVDPLAKRDTDRAAERAAAQAEAVAAITFKAAAIQYAGGYVCVYLDIGAAAPTSLHTINHLGLPSNLYVNNDVPLSGGVSSYQITTSAAPEPATWAFMLLGTGGVGGMLRSRRRVRALV